VGYQETGIILFAPHW